MGSGVRARFLPSPALLHGGWNVGCCRIGLAASAGFGEPELTCPCRPGQAPAGRRVPPTSSAASRPAPRGCKGRSPLHKNNLSLPLPHRGRGGWGSILPLRGREGKKANQRQGRQATNRASLTPGQRRQGESIPPCPPPPPARDTPSPPPGFSQIQFEESSGGFGGLFQESPGVSSSPTKNAWLLPGGSSHAEGITFPVRPGSSGRTRYWRT